MESRRYNILLIEDSAIDARLISQMLANARYVRFTVERAGHLAGGLERLSHGGIDAVLSNLKLPDSQGLETFEALHQHSRKVPIVIVSGSHDEKLAQKCVQLGAQDFLFKEYLDSDVLERAIRYAIQRKLTLDSLDDHRQILQSVLNSMTDGVVVVDENGQCLLVNPAAERTAGFRVADNVPHDQWPRHYGLYQPDGRTMYRAEDLPLARSRRGETVTEQEVVIRQSDSPEKVVINVNAAPLRDEYGQIRGSVAVFRDVTPRRLAEEQIRQLQDLLGE